LKRFTTFSKLSFTHEKVNTNLFMGQFVTS
jgi:hypothetical protein